MATLFPSLFGSKSSKTALGFPAKQEDKNPVKARSPLGFGPSASATATPTPTREPLGTSLVDLVPGVLSGKLDEDRIKSSLGIDTGKVEITSDSGGLKTGVFDMSKLLPIIGLQRYTDLQLEAQQSEIEEVAREAASGDLEATVRLLGQARINEIGVTQIPEMSNQLKQAVTNTVGGPPPPEPTGTPAHPTPIVDDVKDADQFSLMKLNERIQKFPDNITALDAKWFLDYAEFWESAPGAESDRTKKVELAKAYSQIVGELNTDTLDYADAEQRLRNIVSSASSENAYQGLMDQFSGADTAVSSGTLIHKEPGTVLGSPEDIAAQGGVALSQRRDMADNINTSTPGLQQPEDVGYPEDLVVAIRFAANSFNSNPFLSVNGLARMRRGLLPLFNQFDPQFFSRTSPSMVNGLRGLYRAVGLEDDFDFFQTQTTPDSLR